VEQRRDSIYSLLCRIRWLVLFARINSLRNFAEQFLGLSAGFARRLFANSTDFKTDREPLLTLPDVTLDHKCFSALPDEHCKSWELRVASEVLA
jgi:hypothetical protein